MGGTSQWEQLNQMSIDWIIENGSWSKLFTILQSKWIITEEEIIGRDKIETLRGARLDLFPIFSFFQTNWAQKTVKQNNN